MTGWHRGPMLAFDCETTGPNPDTARIVTATAVAIEGAHVDATEWLIAPEVPIPAGATAIHGISTEHALAHGQAPFIAVGAIVRTLLAALRSGSTPLVGMNICYDLTVLDRECRRQGVASLSDELLQVAPIIDIYVLDKHIDRFRKGKRTLTAMAATYGLHIDDAHDARADALTAARIAWKMAEALPQLRIDPFALHEKQIGWRYEQCVSLQDYFLRTDPTAVVNTDWPIQALPFGWDRDQVDQPEPAGAVR